MVDIESGRRAPMSPIKQELLSILDLASEETLQQTLVFLKQRLALRPASGRSVLRHAGTWQGDDFEDCLQAVYDSRSEAKF
jgi:hypothetical protein